METWQQILTLLYGLFSFIGFCMALRECFFKKNPFGPTMPFSVIGAFVWADLVVFGAFWTLVAIIVMFLHDWILFLLILSVYWIVRSVGETIYWLNQQFATVKRNQPRFLIYTLFHSDDAVWFVFQILWQCVTVVAVISSLHFAHLWFISK